MEYVPLGRSGLVSSVIGLGGGSSSRFGLKKGGTRDGAIRLIRTALEEGITFFDGAGIGGGVDELLAEALAGSRQDVLISTKIHLGPDMPLFSDNRLLNRASSWIARRTGTVATSTTLRKRVEQTLRTLRTDRIDVLHLHAVAPRQYPGAAAKALPLLARMKEEGKLRAIGITEAFLNDPHHGMLRAAVGDAGVDAIMVGFNAANASAAEFVIPRANEQGMGVIGMFALRGLLGPNARAEEIARILDEAGVGGLSEFAYRYSRHQPGMHVVLSGTGDPSHLKQNIAAAAAPPLPSSLVDRLRALSSVQVEGASRR